MSKKPKSIADELRKAIAKAERAGQTKYAIAKAAGMPRSMMTRIASGESVPTLDTAQRIADAIGCRILIVSVVAK
jgi:transcriptional regulator with XRE-family HTH domain